MSLERLPLPFEQLPGSLKPFFTQGAPAGKVMMLARGMAPGVGPTDLVTGLYQATHHENEKVKDAARKSAAELPEHLLLGALPTVEHPHVLDFYAAENLENRALLEPILFNQRSADETFQTLAGALREDALLEIIAKNEQRLLRHPPIIEALYMNRATRMSTANRCLELAVRNGAELDIPAYREIARALGAERRFDDPGDQALAEAEADEAFSSALEELDEDEADSTPDDDETEKLKERFSLVGMTVAQKIRLAMVGSGHHRALLLRDPNRTVALATIKSPQVKETEVIRATQSRSINDDVIRHIANTRDWLKIYQIKANLVKNPKCPLPTAMRLLPHLRLTELRSIARSRNVAHTLRQAAQHMLNRKG